jgi:hypothetical protein
MSEFVRLTMLCPAGLEDDCNLALAAQLGDDWLNTLETVLISGGEKYYYAGWQGDETTAEKIRLVCESLSIECYDTPPVGVPTPEGAKIAESKNSTPKQGEKLLFSQSVVIGDLKPEAPR